MRLNQIARKLDTSTETIVACLEKQGVVIKSAPNTKVTNEQIALLAQDLPAAKKLLASVAKKEVPHAEAESPPKDQQTSEKAEDSVVAENTPEEEVVESPLSLPEEEEKTVIVSEDAPEKAISEEETTPAIKATPIKKIKIYTEEKKEHSSSYHQPRKRIPKSSFTKGRPIKETPTPQKPFKKVLGHKKMISRRLEYRKQKKNRHSLQVEGASDILPVTERISTQDLALLFDVSTQELMDACLELGIEVTSNQRLERNVISLAAEAFEKKIEFVALDKEVVEAKASEEDLLPRIPIVVVMGHVDHGKTSLLDYIRNSTVVKGEAGGITQHIGGYKVMTPDKREITFLDTPGHKAFTAMRARGAHVTDIAIIIIAADDGVMPQTKEAISHAQQAGIPMVFAFNKIDLPNVDIDRVKQQLAEINIMVEDWGGKYQTQGISAKTGEGVNELLEKVLLEAEMLELKANLNKKAQGTVIEASIAKGRGYVATVIVQEGTLKAGETMLAGPCFGKIKEMTTTLGERIKTALPATPVQVLGLNGAPQAGETFRVISSEKEARTQASKYRDAVQAQKHRTHYKPLQRFEEELAHENKDHLQINIILKGDADGSVEALADILPTLSTDDVTVKIVHRAIGSISESDVSLATTTESIIIGFHTKIEKQAQQMLREMGIAVKLCHIIYEAMDFVEGIIKKEKAPEEEQVFVGKAEVVKVFTISHVGSIAGCIVREGSIKRNGEIRIIRNGQEVYAGPIKQLKREKDVIKVAKVDTECGISTPNFDDMQEGDFIECFETRTVGA